MRASGAAELLSARAMALMLCFSDYEATGFLDVAAGRLATSDLLEQCVDHALHHAGTSSLLTLTGIALKCTYLMILLLPEGCWW